MNSFLFDFVSPAGAIISSRYEPLMVGLSYLIALIASVIAMHLAEVSRQFHLKRDRHLAMLGGALAMGVAVWGMHFLGMLAFELCTTVQYELVITLLSIFPAFIASWAAMQWMAHVRKHTYDLWLSGTLIGVGIGVMHYTGMLAMQTSAALVFNPWLVMMSVLAALGLAIMALWFHQFCTRSPLLRPWRHLLSGLVMASAITSMHYLGMAAARFIGTPQFSEPVPTVDRLYLSLLVTMGVVTLLGGVLAQTMITRQRQLARELQFKEHQMRVIFQHAIDAIVITDAKGHIQMVNRAFEAMFGVQAQAMAGRQIAKMIPDWKQLSTLSRKRRQHDQAQKVVAERNGVHADGREIPLRIALTRVIEEELDFCISFLMDLTLFRQQQSALEKLLTEDPLTGLFNRRGMLSMMHGMVSQLHAAHDHQGIVLLFVDLDGFKAVNDTYGHPVGDEVLMSIAQRLPNVLREADMVCRYGGDEFVILLTFSSHPEALASMVAEKLIEIIKQPIKLQSGHQINVGCSIGIAYGKPNTAEEIEALLQKADNAMYQAKKGEAGKVVFSS